MASEKYCPDEYWFDSTGTADLCLHCTEPTCVNCSDSDGNACLSCIADRILKTDSSDCVTETECNNESGFWTNTSTCDACTSPCTDCSGDLTTCTACITDYNIYSTGSDETGPFSCNDSSGADGECPDNYYKDSSLAKCNHCISPCIDC